jgi:hypothetical protein
MKLKELELELTKMKAKYQLQRRQAIELQTKLDQAEGALSIALDHLGCQGADHEEWCAEGYGCNVYGDELLRCECEDCDTFLTNNWGDYITVPVEGLTMCEDCQIEQEVEQ